MRILYLDLDTLRPDHLGCYGYHRNTSPNIDRIAAQGVHFDNYYCSDAPCLPSRSALMTGRFGIHTGVVNHGGACADPRIDGAGRGFRDSLSSTSLPATLKQAGLHTVFIGGFGERHSAWCFYAGFREIYDTGKGGMESAEEVTPTVLDWIERNAAKDDWYLHVNYWDPHTPYRAPAGFGNPFADDPLPAWITAEVLEEHKRHAGPHSALDLYMYHGDPDPRWPRYPGELHDMADLRRFIDGYDCGIRYMDDHIGQLFAALEKAGVMDDLAIIISSDHGENLGELGLYGEHGTADHITCRIPMIIRWPFDGLRTGPGGAQGGVDKGLHYNLDLAPTLAELFSRPARPHWDGESFAPAITRGAECGREHLVISQCCHVCQRGVRWGDWLYMRTWHDGYHLFPDEMLYNVAGDPHEQRNLAHARPDLCAEGLRRLTAWHDRMMATMPAGYTEDPMRIVLAEGGPFHARGFLKNYVSRLEGTGRGYAVEELKRRHPREFAG
jgi:arylsulfatase A-like enzyme